MNGAGHSVQLRYSLHLSGLLAVAFEKIGTFINSDDKSDKHANERQDCIKGYLKDLDNIALQLQLNKPEKSEYVIDLAKVGTQEQVTTFKTVIRKHATFLEFLKEAPLVLFYGYDDLDEAYQLTKAAQISHICFLFSNDLSIVWNFKGSFGTDIAFSNDTYSDPNFRLAVTKLVQCAQEGLAKFAEKRKKAVLSALHVRSMCTLFQRFSITTPVDGTSAADYLTKLLGESDPRLDVSGKAVAAITPQIVTTIEATIGEWVDVAKALPSSSALRTSPFIIGSVNAKKIEVAQADLPLIPPIASLISTAYRSVEAHKKPLFDPEAKKAL